MNWTEVLSMYTYSLPSFSFPFFISIDWTSNFYTYSKQTTNLFVRKHLCRTTQTLSNLEYISLCNVEWLPNIKINEIKKLIGNSYLIHEYYLDTIRRPTRLGYLVDLFTLNRTAICRPRFSRFVLVYNNHECNIVRINIHSW